MHVTVPNTYAASHIQSIATTASSSIEKSAANKTTKYDDLTSTNLFVPIAVETSGAWCSTSIEFIKELERRITATTNEPLETTYLFQRLSATLQRVNAVAFRNTYPESSIFTKSVSSL